MNCLPSWDLRICLRLSAKHCLISLFKRQGEPLRMLSCMRTSRIPSRIDNCGRFWVTECLVGDMSVWYSGAALEMPVSQGVLVIAVFGHSEGDSRRYQVQRFLLPLLLLFSSISAKNVDALCSLLSVDPARPADGEPLFSVCRNHGKAWQ